MVSGIDKEKPLLTIAIPTWNRAETLDKALNHLIPQLHGFENEIELVISDNASNDHTNEVVIKYKNANKQLNFVHYRNEVNIQFFGNFAKCRELANGKYIWILSDDDFVYDKIVNKIVTKISKSDQFSCLYLKNNLDLSVIKTTLISNEDLLEKENYSLGLISAVIFLNIKNNDKFLFDKYFKSPFIGFIFLLNSFNYKRESLILEGKCLIGANTKPTGYNFFDVFVNGMNDVINYMGFIEISGNVIRHFRTSYLLKFIRPVYLLYKAENKLTFTNGELSPIEEINTWIYKGYSSLTQYWLFFYPITLIPSSILNIGLKIKRKIKIYK